MIVTNNNCHARTHFLKFLLAPDALHHMSAKDLAHVGPISCESTALGIGELATWQQSRSDEFPP